MQAKWIWIGDEPAVKPRLVYFKKKVSVQGLSGENGGGARCVLSVYADSRYLLFLNGARVMTGPCRAAGGTHYTDTLDVTDFLRDGENEIRVHVIQYPRDGNREARFLAGPNSVVTEGVGGLWIEETGTAFGFSTSREYRCIEVCGYAFPEDAVYGYIGFMERFDARPVHEGTPDSAWQPVTELIRPRAEGIGAVRDIWWSEPRTIPLPYEKADTFRKAAETDGLQKTEDGEFFLPDGGSGSLVLDAGRLVNAYPRVRFSCGAGSRLRITYAEGFGVKKENGEIVRGVRDDPAGQSVYGVSDCYVAFEGLQTYVPFLFRSFYILKLEITACGGKPFVLYGVDYIKTGYPLSVTGEFHASEKTYEMLYAVSLRTLKRCMYETYMDCPYHEQMQYAMDTFLQIRYTLSVSGDSRLARKAIRDFAASQLYDGMIPCNTPSRFKQMIPGFPFYWILMLDTYRLYVGDRPFIREHLGGVDKLLSYYERRLGEDGLWHQTDGWQFFDWVKEWQEGCPVRPGETNILYNMLYVCGLRAAARLNRYCGRDGTAQEYERLADSVSAAIRSAAYNRETGLFSDAPGRAPSSRHAQIFAVVASVVPEEEKRPLMERMLAAGERLSVPSYCMLYFLCRALEETGLYDRLHTEPAVWDAFIRLHDGLHLSTWPEDFVTMRSDCHGWSAVFLYEAAACYLGVQPAEPGFARVRVRPLPCPLDAYSGAVPIGGKGVVRVSVERNADGTRSVSVRAPENVEILYDLLETDIRKEYTLLG